VYLCVNETQLYPVHLITRKSPGLMTRKLSVGTSKNLRFRRDDRRLTPLLARLSGRGPVIVGF
jgi:hypothetical protein